MPPPAVTVWLEGVTDTPKSETTSVTPVVCIRLPLVPVMVSG